MSQPFFSVWNQAFDALIENGCAFSGHQVAQAVHYLSAQGIFFQRHAHQLIIPFGDGLFGVEFNRVAGVVKEFIVPLARHTAQPRN